MKAVYYDSFGGDIRLEQVGDPSPKNHGVVLQVKASGICRSDWHGWMGHDPDISLPHVPGHELSGEIIAKGNQVTKFEVGDRVTVPFVGGCGTCKYCEQGDHQVCPDQFQPGFTHWGSFAEYVGIHYADTNLVKLPDDIDDETAACLGCRFATSYRALVDQAGITPGNSVAIFGCGGVGLSAVMIAKAFDLEVVAVDIDDAKLAMAQQLGADQIIKDLQDGSFVEAFQDQIKKGVNYTLDAIGNQNVIDNAISVLDRRGKHIQVGLLPPHQHLSPVAMNKIIAYELEIKGSHGMQAYRYGDMIKLIQQGKINPKAMVAKRMSLEESVNALKKMDDFAVDGVQMITSF